MNLDKVEQIEYQIVGFTAYELYPFYTQKYLLHYSEPNVSSEATGMISVTKFIALFYILIRLSIQKIWYRI